MIVVCVPRRLLATNVTPEERLFSSSACIVVGKTTYVLLWSQSLFSNDFPKQGKSNLELIPSSTHCYAHVFATMLTFTTTTTLEHVQIFRIKQNYSATSCWYNKQITLIALEKFAANEETVILVFYDGFLANAWYKNLENCSFNLIMDRGWSNMQVSKISEKLIIIEYKIFETVSTIKLFCRILLSST